MESDRLDAERKSLDRLPATDLSVTFRRTGFYSSCEA